LFDHTHLTNAGNEVTVMSNDFSTHYTSVYSDGTVTLTLDAGRLKAAGTNV